MIYKGYNYIHINEYNSKVAGVLSDILYWRKYYLNKQRAGKES